MTVKDLIRYLEHCNPDYPVMNACHQEIRFVIQHWELTDEDSNRVEIY